MHKGILSVTSHFEAAETERAAKDLSSFYLAATKLLLSKCLVKDLLANVFTKQRCWTLTFQNPKLLSCGPLPTLFR